MKLVFLYILHFVCSECLAAGCRVVHNFSKVEVVQAPGVHTCSVLRYLILACVLGGVNTHPYSRYIHQVLQMCCVLCHAVQYSAVYLYCTVQYRQVSGRVAAAGLTTVTKLKLCRAVTVAGLTLCKYTFILQRDSSHNTQIVTWHINNSTSTRIYP